MRPSEHLASLSREDLLALVVTLQCQIVELTARNEALHAEIERLRRGTKRQAAPFSQGTRVASPQRPGRPPGSGSFCYRAAPRPAQIPEPPVDVPVPLAACPACGGRLTQERVDCASTTDIPAMPGPKVTPYRVSVGRGMVCGPQVRGQQPDVAPDQYGATAHRVGDRTMATAPGLPDGSGLPGRQGPLVLAAMPGITLTQGAIPQDARRRATGAVGEIYDRWRPAVPTSPLVHTDATGWRGRGDPAYLMAFDTDEATVSQIRSQHRHEEVQEGIPSDDTGGMVTARGRSDDAQAFDDVQQQKCLAHILRSMRDVLATQQGRARDCGERLTALWQDAIPLWRAWHAGEGADFPTEAQALGDALTHHLRPRMRTDPDNQRWRHGLGRQHDRSHLLRCLEAPQVEPTTNRAERVLRPAVIARQVSQCSKNQAGAHAFAACKSVVQTLAKQGVDSMVEGLSRLFRSAQLHAAPP